MSTVISLVTAAGAVKELAQDVIAEGKFTGTDARDALEIALAFKPTGTPTVSGNEDEILNRLFGLGVASGAAASGGGSGGGEFPIPDGRANLN